MARNWPATATSGTAAAPGPAGGRRRAVTLVLICYLLAGLAVTMRLWADPAANTVAGNPNDADLFAWFLRYDATAVAHLHLPALVTAAMNAPQGVNVMWNTFLLLPGVLLAPVTLLFGPQVSLIVLTTAGFAGSATSMFFVLRRWQVSIGAAAMAGAVYGFSPALLHAAIGHDNLQFAVLPPLIIDSGLRLCTGSAAPLREGIRLGLLVTAQFFTGEELLLCTGIAGLLLVAGLAAGQPLAVLRRRCQAAAAGLGLAAGVTLLLAGHALWVQFFGPLRQHGSAFTPDFFKNDLTSFVTPSRYQVFHTAASAAAAASYQGGAPEYLAYLGWPLIAVLALATLACWRHPAVRAAALTVVVLELLSLGAHPLISGTTVAGVTLPWRWLENLPVFGSVLPDRLSIVADGAAAVLLAFAVDLTRSRVTGSGVTGSGVTGSGVTGSGVTGTGVTGTGVTGTGVTGTGVTGTGVTGTRVAGGRVTGSRVGPALVTAVAALACLPLLPRPLPAASATPLPAGWTAAIAGLRLPPGARVLVVPVPTPALTLALRWQADTGRPDSLIGGYFVGPASTGQAYIGGNGATATAKYLDRLWFAGLPQGGLAAAAAATANLTPLGAAPAQSQVRSDLAAWRPAAVVAVTSADSPLGRYLAHLFGRPVTQVRDVIAWRA